VYTGQCDPSSKGANKRLKGKHANLHTVCNNGLTFYCFQHLSECPEIRHGITTRRGGNSLPPFDSLNMARSLGDNAAHVAVNRRRVQAQFDGMEPVYLKQVHSNIVVALDGVTTGEAPYLHGAADAVVTDRPGRLLTILVADCQPVILYDPVRGVIANIHSGWRGSITNIIGHTVAVMKKRFACRPADILAGIGPSLGPCCAEFIHYRDEIPPSLWSYQVAENHFDFWSLSRDQLVAAGLRPQHVEVAGICSRCRNDLFFSYRAANITGRMAAVIGLRPSSRAGQTVVRYPT
jgi:YfiH family protein